MKRKDQLRLLCGEYFMANECLSMIIVSKIEKNTISESNVQFHKQEQETDTLFASHNQVRC